MFHWLFVELAGVCKLGGAYTDNGQPVPQDSHTCHQACTLPWPHHTAHGNTLPCTPVQCVSQCVVCWCHQGCIFAWPTLLDPLLSQTHPSVLNDTFASYILKIHSFALYKFYGPVMKVNCWHGESPGCLSHAGGIEPASWTISPGYTLHSTPPFWAS